MITVLGIETSCDETAVAVVRDDRTILSHEILSQTEHEIYGGVVPEVAARAHLGHIDALTRAAMVTAGIGFADLDAIAVTAGPGLIGGVMVGVMTAKAIAAVHNKPILGVNHLEGHALTPRLSDDVPFPYLLLLVSGGHCQLLVVEGVGKYKRLGTTIDDAVGECFDKTAKILGLGYPGGPAVEKIAAQCLDGKAALARFPLPRPLFGKAGCDFSFSGLKTAVRRIAETVDIDDAARIDLCFAFQETVAAVLQDRTRRAVRMYKDMVSSDMPRTLVTAGGVAANKRLCGMLQDLATAEGIGFTAPPLKLCTDNAAMIAWAGIERFRLGLQDPIDFKVHARWPLDPDAPIASIKSQKV